MIDFLKSLFALVGWILCAVILAAVTVYASVCAGRECLSVSISEPTTSNAHAEPITSPRPDRRKAH